MLGSALAIPQTSVSQTFPAPVVRPLDTQAIETATPRTTAPDIRQPDDPLYSMQWNLHSTVSSAGAANLQTLLELKGQARMVVAVVDSGFLLTHEDIDFLPGYDFVSTLSVANDGDGRDHDPTDPGDWVATSTNDCQVQTSSWHGTRVAGIIGASTSNAIGIAAANNRIDLLPVRVTGTCGGYVADLIDGIRWAAGLSVANVPPNPHPASVINVSLGFPGACPAELQQAISSATSAGAIVVTASTNSGVDLDVAPHSPASCEQVLTAGAATRAGRRADYSAYGAAVDVLAPGGDRSDGILTTDNLGRAAAEPGSHYGRHFGTSLAGAHLSAAVAALRAFSGTLTLPQIRAIVRSTATPVGVAGGCELLACGGGLLDAQAAMRLATGVNADDLPVAPQLPVAAAANSSFGGGTVPLFFSLGLLSLAVVRRARRCRRIAHV